MQNNDRNIEFMHCALDLAQKGAGATYPNPMVGAVIVSNNKIVGKGYHERFGQNHAEINAIENCLSQGYETKGATMFVTLEPCCHFGKTPPCSQAIIDAGIRHVEIACIDNNPQVDQKGIKQLKDHGITVNVGCCERQARRLNTGFLKWKTLGQPQVILKWAQSKNGKLAWPKQSNRRWISSEASRNHTHHNRRKCGAILVGINTVLEDDPQLNVRLNDVKRQPIRIVLDSSLRIPTTCNIVKTAKKQDVLICCSKDGVKQQEDKINELTLAGCQIFSVDQITSQEGLNLILDELGRRDIIDLMVEGGAAIHNSFLKYQLADQLQIYISPDEINGNDLPSVLAYGNKDISVIEKSLFDVEILQIDRDQFINGYIHEKPIE